MSLESSSPLSQGQHSRYVEKLEPERIAEIVRTVNTAVEKTLRELGILGSDALPESALQLPPLEHVWFVGPDELSQAEVGVVGGDYTHEHFIRVRDDLPRARQISMLIHETVHYVARRVSRAELSDLGQIRIAMQETGFDMRTSGVGINEALTEALTQRIIDLCRPEFEAIFPEHGARIGLRRDGTRLSGYIHEQDSVAAVAEHVARARGISPADVERDAFSGLFSAERRATFWQQVSDTCPPGTRVLLEDRIDPRNTRYAENVRSFLAESDIETRTDIALGMLSRERQIEYLEAAYGPLADETITHPPQYLTSLYRIATRLDDLIALKKAASDDTVSAMLDRANEQGEQYQRMTAYARESLGIADSQWDHLDAAERRRSILEAYAADAVRDERRKRGQLLGLINRGPTQQP